MRVMGPTPLVIGFFTWKNGSWVKAKTGKGIIRQMGEQLMVAARHSLLPPWYYTFELYQDDARRRAGEYLHRFETKRFLYPFLRQYNGGLPVPAQRSTEALSDKALFASHCGAHGLRAVQALMVFRNGEVIRSAGPPTRLPETDLFIKTLRGSDPDAAVYYNLTSMLRAQINVENLFDENYYLNAHSNMNITPGSPRAVRFALTTRF